MTTETNDPWEVLAAPSTRTPRSLETREKSERSRTWSQPSILPEIEPRDGWVHKWVRTDTRNVPDKTTYSKRLREGWEPIDVAEYPELIGYAEGRHTGRAEVGGLVACRMPAEMVKQRTDHYSGVTRDQETAAEEHYLRDSNELMKKVAENKRRVVFGR